MTERHQPQAQEIIEMSARLQPSIFINPQESEWGKMWASLQREDGLQPDDFSAWNETWGEGWQYMSTEWEDQGQCFVHQFRHRAHPRNDERTYKNIPVSAGWMPSMEVSK